ncbi:MAG TPA: hypothetical protein H9994_02855 [Candidatus Salinicoccus merdavium]|nr:hypothetical protein [Candidatus Salinicoccus merdavium]
MNDKFNILKGSLTTYQLSEALEMTIEQVEAVLNGEMDVSDLNPDVINNIHHLEAALFGHVEK